MKISKDQLKNTVLAQAKDTGFITSVAASCINTLPVEERKQFLIQLMVDLEMLTEFYSLYHGLTGIRYFHLTSHEAFMQIKVENPSATLTGFYSAVRRKGTYKNYLITHHKK